MNELLAMLVNLLKQQTKFPFFEVYASFDAIPVDAKSRKLFVVITPDFFQLNQAFPDGKSGIAPFTASFRISVLAPMLTPCDRLLEFFYTNLVPILQSANCFLYEMQSEIPKIDSKLQKLVYSSTFRLKGIYIPDKEGSA